MLITRRVEILWRHNNKEWFEKRGYVFKDYKTPVLVNVNDLKPNSNAKVKVQCDYCSKETVISYQLYFQRKNKFENKKDCCKKCEPLKRVERSLRGNFNFDENSIDKAVNYRLKNKDKVHIPAVYMIRNIVTGRIYIGSTKRLIRRLDQHKEDLRIGKNSKLMCEDFERHGWGSFECTVLEIVEDISMLLEREQSYLNMIQSDLLYNWSNKVTNKGFKHSKKTIEGMIASKKGRKLSDEHKERISEGVIRSSRRNVKLNEEKVRDIKALLKETDKTMTEIGRMYGVGRHAISAIKHGKSWNHVS